MIVGICNCLSLKNRYPYCPFRPGARCIDKAGTVLNFEKIVC